MDNKSLPDLDDHIKELLDLCVYIDINKDDEVNNHLVKVSEFMTRLADFIVLLYKENQVQKINEKLNLIERAITSVNQTLLTEIVIYNNSDEPDEWADQQFEFNIYLLDHVIKDLFKQIIGAIVIACINQKLNPNLFGSFVFNQNLATTKKVTDNITSFKSQILILKELGIFNLPEIEKLTLKKRGEFIARLLNRNIDNAKDYIGNLYDEKGESGSKSPYNEESKNQAKDILALIGLNLSLKKGVTPKGTPPEK